MYVHNLQMSSVKIGDVFNETDEDDLQRVVEIHPKRDPPIAICCSMKREDESESTEEEYALEYVGKCVKARQQYVQEGFADYDVYKIKKMQKKRTKVCVDSRQTNRH